MSISVIDYRSPSAMTEITRALKAIGFAVISHHTIKIELMNEAYQLWYEFFARDEKHQFAFNTETHDGFVSTGLSEKAKGYDKKDLKEFYHYYCWGRCPDSLRPATQALYEDLYHLATQLLNGVQENTPPEITKQFSMPLSQMIENSHHSLLRLIHYPPLTGNEDPNALRAAPHEDINLLTLLPAATAKGLQVKDTAGNWVEVPCEKGWIIVNTGDMLQECTNFYYPSTTHRVINPTGLNAKEPRLSMPLFLHPRDEVRLSDQYTAQSYRHERFKELGLMK